VIATLATVTALGILILLGGGHGGRRRSGVGSGVASSSPCSRASWASWSA
jgi:hypothetical protein